MGLVVNIRFDKWLWAARFYKTRSLAKAAIESGKARYNGERTKPSRAVELGANLQVQQGYAQKTVVITGLCAQRKGAVEAALLYRETEDSIAHRTTAAKARKMLKAGLRIDHKPNKKERRALRALQERSLP